MDSRSNPLEEGGNDVILEGLGGPIFQGHGLVKQGKPKLVNCIMED